jgi:hypothetical protein
MLAIAVVLVTLFCGLALGTDVLGHGPRERPLLGDGTGDIARQARNDGASYMTEDEASSIASMMANIPEGVDAPSLSRMTPIRDGVVLLDDPDMGRIVGVESQAGDLCTMYEWRGKARGMGCGSGMPASGVGFSWAFGGDGEFLEGAIAPDISRITIITRSGSRTDAAIGRGVAAWRGEPSDHPMQIIVEHRAGPTRSYNMTTLNTASE